MNTLLSHEQLNQQDLALSSQGHSVLRPSLGLIVVGSIYSLGVLLTYLRAKKYEKEQISAAASVA